MKTNSAYYLISIILMFTGCASPATPDQVATSFWNAAVAQDENRARNYVTETTRKSVNFSKIEWHNGIVTLGEIRINGDDATVETKIEISKNGKQSITHLQTVLNKKDGKWKVDYDKTKQTIVQNNALADAMKEIREFSADFSKQLNEAFNKSQKEMPKVEKELKSLGDTLQKGMDNAKEKVIPELEKNIEDFTKRLRESLEEALKKKEEKQQQDHHSNVI